MDVKFKEKKYFLHKMEMPLIILSAILSIIIFVALMYLGYKSFYDIQQKNAIEKLFAGNEDIFSMMGSIGGFVAFVVIAILLFITYVTMETIKDKTYGREIHITDKQFGNLLEFEKECVKKLGLTQIPKMYVVKAKTEIEVKGAIFESEDMIRIINEEAFCTINDGDYAAKFTIAKHLAAIYIGYYNKIYLLIAIFAMWIPVYNSICSRIIEYTTDKVAAELIGKEDAMKAIMTAEINLYALPYVNIDEYMNTAKEIANSKKIIYENIISNIPIPAYRIEAIRTGKDGRLF